MLKRSLFLICLLMLLGCSKESGETICKYDIPEKTVVSFSAVGDNLIHSTVYLDALQADGSYDFSKMYENFALILHQSDIAYINQETVIGGNEFKPSGYPAFNTPNEMAYDLKEVGFNLVNLASNHCLDKGEKAIFNEKDLFDSIDSVTTDGVYRSQEEFDTIATFEKKGIVFSFLSYTYGTNGIIPAHSYNVSYFEDDLIEKEVQEAKKISDVVIVSAHWGDENTFEVNSFQKHYAQLFADLGVDVVIGTHSHTIQPVEWVRGKEGNQTLVAYSLGNFMGGMLSADNIIGGLLQFDFVKQNNQVMIENVTWQPTVIHFEGNKNNIYDERYNYKTYLASEYTHELAEQHVLNGYNGNIVSLEKIDSLTQRIVDASFLEE